MRGNGVGRLIESFSKDASFADAFECLFENASDAMPKGGTLTITSKESNGNLEITFTDTGIGMPKEVMEKIWTPLFTTKAKGMGLGLPICKRIVEAHRGNISVAKAPWVKEPHSQ